MNIAGYSAVAKFKNQNDEQTARNGRLEDKCRTQLSCAPPVAAAGWRMGDGERRGARRVTVLCLLWCGMLIFDLITHIFAASRPSTKLKVQLHARARAMLRASEREKCKDSALSICLNAVVIHTRSCQRFINVEIRRLTRWK